MNHDYVYICNGRTVEPINPSEFSLKGTKPNDFWRTFISDLKSDIVFDNHSGDFDYFKSLEGECGELSFSIYRGSVVKFSGYFSCNSGKWNNDRKIFAVKAKPNDESRAILDGLKITQNILALGLDRVSTIGITMPSLAYSDRLTVKQSSYWKVVSGVLVREDFGIPNTSGTPQLGTTILSSVYPYYGAGLSGTTDTVESVTGEQLLAGGLNQWIALEVKIEESADQTALTNNYLYPPLRINQYETLITEIYTVEGTDIVTPPATGATVKEATNINGIDVVIWWRRPNYTLQATVYLDRIEQSGISVDSPLAYTRWKTSLADIYPKVTYTRNLYLFEVISAMLTAIGYTGTFQSRFLTDDVNYVTNEQSKTNKITIAQRSDIELPTSTEPATLAEITLEEMFTELNRECDLYLGFENDILVLEHYSYWNFGLGIDATAYHENLNKSDSYEYLSVKSPNKETWQFADYQNTDFQPNSIIYNVVCTNNDEESIKSCKFCTDLAYMAASGTPTKLGFALFANEVIDGTMYVINEAGKRSGGIVSNGHLSLSNLVENYHRHDRVRLTGRLNFQNQTFESTSKKKKQVEITIPTSFDYNKDVKTTIGTGEVSQYDENLQNKHVKLTLLYD